jgi:hypothetical protein
VTRKTRGSDNKRSSQRGQVLKYWVEVREVSTGVVRTLPLQQFAKIHIPRKKNDEQRPREEVLRLGDGPSTLEASSLEDLAAQLREKYPDSLYERTFHQERDLEAERVRGDALDRLAQLVMEAFTRNLSGDDAAAFSAWMGTKEGKKGFRELWPKMVDAYFHALCNPQKRAPHRSSDSHDLNE